MPDALLQEAVDEARRRGCRQPSTGAEITHDVAEWLADLRAEVDRFGESAGPPSWNLVIWDSWEPEVPCLCVFETAAQFGEVELQFFVIPRRSRDVVDWAENAPRDVETARTEFRVRWGAPYASVRVKV